MSFSYRPEEGQPKYESLILELQEISDGSIGLFDNQQHENYNISVGDLI